MAGSCGEGDHVGGCACEIASGPCRLPCPASTVNKAPPREGRGILTVLPLGMVSGTRSASSPFKRLWKGDEDVATPFRWEAVSR
jgi:hypothetical protein